MFFVRQPTGQLAKLQLCAAVCSAFVSLSETSQLFGPFHCCAHAYTLATAQDAPMCQVHNAAFLIDIAHVHSSICTKWPDMPGVFGMTVLP